MVATGLPSTRSASTFLDTPGTRPAKSLAKARVASKNNKQNIKGTHALILPIRASHRLAINLSPPILDKIGICSGLSAKSKRCLKDAIQIPLRIVLVSIFPACFNASFVSSLPFSFAVFFTFDDLMGITEPFVTAVYARAFTDCCPQLAVRFMHLCRLQNVSGISDFGLWSRFVLDPPRLHKIVILGGWQQVPLFSSDVNISFLSEYPQRHCH